MPDVMDWYSKLLLEDSRGKLRQTFVQVARSKGSVSSAELKVKASKARVLRSREALLASDRLLSRLYVA